MQDNHIILKGILNRIQEIKTTNKQRFDDELEILQSQYNLYVNLI